MGLVRLDLVAKTNGPCVVTVTGAIDAFRVFGDTSRLKVIEDADGTTVVEVPMSTEQAPSGYGPTEVRKADGSPCGRLALSFREAVAIFGNETQLTLRGGPRFSEVVDLCGTGSESMGLNKCVSILLLERGNEASNGPH